MGVHIDGKCARSSEMSEAITFLDPSMKTPLGRLQLSRVCIRSIHPQHSGNKREVARFTAEVMVEEMKLSSPASPHARRR